MDKQDEALQGNSMPIYHGKRFINEEINHAEQESKDAHKSFLSFLPAFPRTWNFFPLFGRYTSVIPEETDDAVTHIEQTKELAITEEVKNLGLTAQPIIEKDSNKFEPYWVEKDATRRKGHSRNSSFDFSTSDIHIDHAEFSSGDLPVKDKSVIENKEQSILHFPLATFIGKEVAEVDKEKCKEKMIKRRGNIFRRDDNHDTSATFMDHYPNYRKRGQIFRMNSGMVRSTSEGSLNKLVTDQTISEQRTEVEAVDSPEVVGDSLGLRRRSSTGNLQKLDTENSFQEVDRSSNSSSVSDLCKADGLNEMERNANIALKHIDLETAEGHTHAMSFSEQLKSYGTQSVNWASTKKVRHSKRENHMFSPTSF